MNSCQPLRFISTQASCKKPCWTPRQHDTISNGNKSTHLKRLAAFAKASRSQKHNVCLSGQSQHTEAAALTAAHSGQSCPDCSSGPTRVIEGSSSTVSSQPSRISPEPFTITKRQTTASSKTSEDFFFFFFLLCSPAQSVSTPNVQQTSRNHMLVKVR